MTEKCENVSFRQDSAPLHKLKKEAFVHESATRIENAKNVF